MEFALDQAIQALRPTTRETDFDVGEVVKSTIHRFPAQQLSARISSKGKTLVVATSTVVDTPDRYFWFQSIVGPGSAVEASNAMTRAIMESLELDSFAEARKRLTTRLVRREAENTPVPTPPSGLFEVVHYDAPVGKLAAYLSPDPGDGKKHPAIIWVFGGLSNSIGDTAWEPASPANDQSASAFRKAGIIMMYPSFRGGNDNPGFKEGFFGEVDDVLAAADFLARQDHVDPQRIYLGGHSTGGTLVLLAAAASDRFRAVFSFGPVGDPAAYHDEGEEVHDTSNPHEIELRAPERWLSQIASPTFVFEGTEGNISSLAKMATLASSRPKTNFYPIQGADHFEILAPLTALIARKITSDHGRASAISFTQAELDGSR